MPWDLGDAVVFVRVVQHGSFTAAARALGMSKARISRKVGELEDRIGTRLLKRSTRRLGLTEAGHAYFETCAPLLQALQDAEASVAELAGQPVGRVSLTAPAWFAADVLAPLLVDFRAQHPAVELGIVGSHVPLDLIAEDVDLAFRLWIGALPPSDQTVRHLASLPQRIFAGARYVADRGAPSSPEGLAGHPALVSHVRRRSEADRVWLTDGKTDGEYTISTVAIASDPAILRAMMDAGAGLLLATEWQMRRAVAAGEAVPVLPEWRGRPVELYVMLPAGRRVSRKVRLLLDFLIPRLVAAASA